MAHNGQAWPWQCNHNPDAVPAAALGAQAVCGFVGASRNLDKRPADHDETARTDFDRARHSPVDIVHGCVNARSDFNWAKLQGVRGHVCRHTVARRTCGPSQEWRSLPSFASVDLSCTVS